MAYLRCDLDRVDDNDSLESIEKFEISEPASDMYASVLSLSSPLYTVLLYCKAEVFSKTLKNEI